MEKRVCYICKEKEERLRRESRVIGGKLIKLNTFYHQSCLDRKRKTGCFWWKKNLKYRPPGKK